MNTKKPFVYRFFPHLPACIKLIKHFGLKKAKFFLQ